MEATILRLEQQKVITRDEARLFIGDVRTSNGGISDDAMLAVQTLLGEKHQLEIQRAIEGPRTQLGGSLQILCQQLYTTKTRFVYELIQNADDNKYNRSAELPCIKFALWPDRFIIDTNEDGFRPSHVYAICQVAQSTKAGQAGYIGEKGIGFKSVFQIAKKVCIMSDPFFFSFNYNGGVAPSDAMGMVTPQEEEPDHYLEYEKSGPLLAIGTRMVLVLQKKARLFEEAVHELCVELPDALLLFLNKLKEIRIAIHHTTLNPHTTDYTLQTTQSPIQIIRKSRNGEAGTKLRYFVVRTKCTAMPSDSLRENIKETTIVVALPLKEDKDVPLLRRQHVFAYLPLQDYGFNFVIQADFVAKADRQGVFASQWNDKLLSGVAGTFWEAVKQCQVHEILRWRWIRYLPGDTVSDPYWTGLKDQVYAMLRNQRCLESLDGKFLSPQQLRLLAIEHLDENDDPLFPDTSGSGFRYISTHYEAAEVADAEENDPHSGISDEVKDNDKKNASTAGSQVKTGDGAGLNEEHTASRNDHMATSYKELLRNLGVNQLTDEEFVHLVELDLLRKDSVIKSASASEDWHSRVSKVLLAGSFVVRLKVWSLSIVPLQDGRWIKPLFDKNLQGIYFADVDGTEIPTDLGFNLIAPGAAANPDRANLFMSWGARKLSVQEVTDRIALRYKEKSPVTLQGSVQRLKFMYKTGGGTSLSLVKEWPVFTSKGLLVKPPSSVYLPSPMSDWGATKLFAGRIDSPKAPGRVVHLLNDSYSLALDSSDLLQNGTQWLVTKVGTRKAPFLSVGSSKYHDDFKYVLDYRKDQLLNILSYYGATKYSINPQIAKEIVSSGKGPVALCQTYLPSHDLCNIVESFGIVNFPFLKMPDTFVPEKAHNWLFLNIFQVTISDSLNFYIELLDCLIQIGPTLQDGLFSSKILKLYGVIQKKFVSPEDKERLKTIFVQNRICILGTDGRFLKAVGSGKCVWKGPTWLTVKHCLENSPEHAMLSHLFRMVLEIQDATFQDTQKELETMRKANISDYTKVLTIYKSLMDDYPQNLWLALRNVFEKYALVFDPTTSKWYSPTNCVWAPKDIVLKPKISIADSYKRLQRFFCKTLEISPPDLKMHVETLKTVATSVGSEAEQSIIPQVKDQWERISAIRPSSSDLSALSGLKIFPIRGPNSSVQLVDRDTEFAIIDRQEYEEDFKSKIKTLDFSLDDLLTIRPMLLAMDLEKRQMSKLVSEATSNPGGRPDQLLTTEFRNKASAIFSCASNFGSPKTRDYAMFDSLQSATVHISTGIVKTISVKQDGRVFKVSKRPANFHLESDADGLKLYVPEAENQRELCYLRQLPDRLLSFFQITHHNAAALFGSIIQARSVATLKALLEDAGIVIDPRIRQAIQLAPPIAAVSATADILPQTNNISTTDSDEDTLYEESSSASAFRPQVHGGVRSSVFSSSSAGLFTPDAVSVVTREQELSIPLAPPVANFETRYKKLLDRIITAAGAADIPVYCQSSDFSTAIGTDDLGLPLFLDMTPERNTKVGAAGELFVYRLLLALSSTPGFDLSNWESTIRHHALEQPWSSRETADITYDDISGSFTELLIAKRYFTRAVWAGKKPKYYIEVKTTPGACGTTFFMSHLQHKRMSEYVLSPFEAADNVYIIFRVSKIEDASINLRLFVDPARYSKHHLDFAGQGWAVTPRENIEAFTS